MKYYIFYREDNNFSGILNDNNIKKLFSLKIKYHMHLILGGSEIPKDLQSYIVLKYGDDLQNKKNIFIDRKPIISKDYVLNDEQKRIINRIK